MPPCGAGVGHRIIAMLAHRIGHCRVGPYCQIYVHPCPNRAAMRHTGSLASWAHAPVSHFTLTSSSLPCGAQHAEVSSPFRQIVTEFRVNSPCSLGSNNDQIVPASASRNRFRLHRCAIKHKPYDLLGTKATSRATITQASREMRSSRHRRRMSLPLLGDRDGAWWVPITYGIIRPRQLKVRILDMPENYRRSSPFTVDPHPVECRAFYSGNCGEIPTPIFGTLSASCIMFLRWRLTTSVPGWMLAGEPPSCVEPCHCLGGCRGEGRTMVIRSYMEGRD